MSFELPTVAQPWLLADWPTPPGVTVFTTLRHGAGSSIPPFDRFNLGNRTAADGDDPVVVEANRAELVRRAALPSWPHWLRQVHGTGVFRATGPGAPLSPADEPMADASVTDVPGVVLAILTADCLPVVFAADDGSEVGAAHAGWRGLADGMLEETVASMRTPSDHLCAWLGPAAGPASYEVGGDVRAAFVGQDAAAEQAFTATRPGHWKVDLYLLARQRLARAGLHPGMIHGGTYSTIDQPQHFFSHRRDRRSGRMATLVWMNDR